MAPDRRRRGSRPTRCSSSLNCEETFTPWGHLEGPTDKCRWDDVLGRLCATIYCCLCAGPQSCRSMSRRWVSLALVVQRCAFLDVQTSAWCRDQMSRLISASFGVGVALHLCTLTGSRPCEVETCQNPICVLTLHRCMQRWPQHCWCLQPAAM